MGTGIKEVKSLNPEHALDLSKNFLGPVFFLVYTFSEGNARVGWLGFAFCFLIVNQNVPFCWFR